MASASDLAARIVSGHATAKHLRAFAALGITTSAQYEAHIVAVLADPETRCFTAFRTTQKWREADIYYHPKTNTFIVAPRDIKQEATAYQSATKGQAFIVKHKEAKAIESRNLPIARGFAELQEQKRTYQRQQARRQGRKMSM